MESLIHEPSGIEDRVHNASLDKGNTSTEEDFIRDQQREFLLDLFKRNQHTPIHVSQVVLNGAEQLRDDVVQNYLADTIYKADTFEQLCKYSDWLHYKMVSNGMVESLSQSLDSRGSYSIQVSERNYGDSLKHVNMPETLSVVDVVPLIRLHPIKRFSAKTGTNIGNGEGDGYIQFELRNIFRGGEKLTFDATKGTKTHSSYMLNYFHPLQSPWWVSDTTLYKNARQLGNCELFVKGITTGIKSSYFQDGSINHDFRWESLLRSCDIKSAFASSSLLFSAGDNVKHAIVHTMSQDTRDNLISPNNGYVWKLANELSLGKHLKTSIECNVTKSCLKNNFITLSSTVKAGYIHNFHGRTYPLHIIDKFYNGGSNDVRSFQLMGLGPKDIFDYVGGDTSLSYGLSIFSKLPFKRFAESNFRLHLFFNGGRLINRNNSSVQDVFKQMLCEHSLSTGFGIVFRHPVARFELNFTLPITAHCSDATRKGFQYGIGISFL